jgi:hypothetical protein
MIKETRGLIFPPLKKETVSGNLFMGLDVHLFQLQRTGYPGLDGRRPRYPH